MRTTAAIVETGCKRRAFGTCSTSAAAVVEERVKEVRWVWQQRQPPFRQTPLPRRTTAVVNPLRRVRQLLPPYTQSAITTATAAITKLEYQSTEITPSYPVTRSHIAVRQSFRLRRRAVIVGPASLYIWYMTCLVVVSGPTTASAIGERGVRRRPQTKPNLN